MRAITVDIHTMEISAIGDADSFGELPPNLLLISENQWEADPMPGQVWQGNIPASFWPDVETVLVNAKAKKKADVEDLILVAFDRGFTIPFGTMIGSVLQVRSDNDRTNWLTSQASYSTMVALGKGALAEAEFRDISNTTHVVTYMEGLNVLLQMAKWGSTVMKRSWVLKDEIKLATSLEELEAIDIEAGWPA